MPAIERQTDVTPVTRSRSTPSDRKRARAPRYAVWMGALVTGFGSHGAPCWLTRLSVESMRLTLAKPAKLSTSRLKPGRTIVVHLSHRNGDAWRIIPMRAKIVRAQGNSFGVRIVAPEQSVIAGLIQDLVKQGKAKPVLPRGGADTLSAAVSSATVIPPSSRARDEKRSLAVACKAVIQKEGLEWMGKVFDKIAASLISDVSKTKEQVLRRHLEECYLGFMMVRETLTEEGQKQLLRVVDDLFFAPSGQAIESPTRGGSSRSLDLMGTLDLNSSLAYNGALDTLLHSVSPTTLLQTEMRLSEILDEEIDEQSNPLRPDRIGMALLGTIYEHWYAGTSIRQTINDALRDNGVAMSTFFEALSSAIVQVH